MADDSADLSINLNSNIPEQSEASIKSLKGLKAAYKDAMNEAAKGTAGAAQKAADLKDQLEDLQDATKSLKGSGVEKLTSSMNLLKDGFTNADPGKLSIAMKGLGAAMKAIPIFLIIEGIKYLIDNFEKLANSGGIIGKVFSAIGDAISWVIEKIKEFTDWIGISNFAVEDKAEKTIEAAKAEQEAVTNRYDAEIKLAKAAGKDTTELEIKKQQAIIDSAKIQFEAIKAVAAANGEVTEEQTKKVQELGKVIADAQLEIDVAKVTQQKKTEDEKKKLNDEAVDAYKKRMEAEKKEDADRLAAARKNLEEVKNLQKAMLASIAADALAAQKKKEAEEDAAADKEVEAIQKNAAARRKLQEMENAKTLEGRIQNLEAIRDATLKSETATAGERLLAQRQFEDAKAAVEKEYADKAKAEREKQNKTILAGINSLASSISSILQSIDEYNQMKADEAVKVNEEALNQQLTALDAARDQELAKEGLTADQKTAINNKYAKQKYELELKEYNANTEIKKKAFEQDKKMKIAQAVISTITGAISAVTGMIQAIPGPIGIILGVAAGLAVTAAGVIQVAKIKNTQFEAGSPPSPPNLAVPSANAGGGLSGSTSEPIKPNFDIFNTGQTSANNQSNQSSNKPPVVKAYVVSQEITDQQTANNYSTTMGTL